MGRMGDRRSYRGHKERFRPNPEHEDAFGFGYREYAGYGMRDGESEPVQGHKTGLGEGAKQLGDVLVGRVRRLFRPPKGYLRADERIREEICEKLGASERVDPTDVEVTVNAGEVTLKGAVPERPMKWVAEQIIDQVSGVIEIHNQLRVMRVEREATPSAQQPPRASSPTLDSERRR
jgi:hypothetical protein